MANTSVLEIPLDQRILTVLHTKAQEGGRSVEQLTQSIIAEWANRQQNLQVQMSPEGFIDAARKLSGEIERRVGETSDSVEILREIRKERSR